MLRHLEPLLLWIGIPVVAGLALLPGLHAGPSLDAAVFGLMGREFAGGAVPYAEAWDHKPPGVYLVHAMADILPGSDTWAWTWLLTLLSTCAAAWLVAAIVRPTVSPPAAVAAGLGTALGLGHFVLSLGGGMSESFAVLPATAALAPAIPSPMTVQRSALVGTLVGLAVIISPQFAPAAVAALLLVGSEALPLITFLGAAAAPAVVVVGAFAAAGVLPEFLDAIVTYNVAYRDAPGPGLALLPWITLLLVGLAAPALAGVLALRRASLSARRLGLASVAWLVVAVALIGFQGRLYGHYAISLVVPLAVLAAIGLERLNSRLRATRARAAADGITVGLIVLSLVAGGAGARMELAMIEAVNARARAVAAWTEEEGLRGERMLVWGNAPQVYQFSGSVPATRYGFLYPLTTPGYANGVAIADALANLEASPAEVVVDAGSEAPGEPGFPPLLIDRPVATDGRDLDLLDPLRAFVAGRYELVDIVHGWPIYRRATATGD